MASRKAGASQGSVALGGQGPAHVVAAEAQLHEATGEATFRGQARLWQQANSVAAPVIVLDRERQTLVARTTDAAEPVRAVLVSAAELRSKAGKAGPACRDSGARRRSEVLRCRAQGGDARRRSGHGGGRDGNGDLGLRMKWR